MRSYSPFLRPLAFAALAIAVLGVTGCKWFRKGNPDYAMSAETRPLEVPPDLNLPNTAGAMKLPPVGSQATAATQSAAASATGFNVAGTRDEVFAKVGEALAGVDGLTIASRAQLLGSYDVNYEGSNFLVRVVAVEAGAYVSAVDPRGLPAAGSAPKLIAALKAKLGG
ncbi:MAG TPA: hypothetical protein VF471_04245 [Pseudoxanthomonas sp.]